MDGPSHMRIFGSPICCLTSRSRTSASQPILMTSCLGRLLCSANNTLFAITRTWWSGLILRKGTIIQIMHVHGTYWFYDCCNLSDDITDRAQPLAQSASTMAARLDLILSQRVPLVQINSVARDEDFRELLNSIPPSENAGSYSMNSFSSTSSPHMAGELKRARKIR